MYEDALEGDRPSVKLNRPRFRFGLKTMLVLVALACVWLGMRAARERRATEMATRRNTIFDALDSNPVDPPAGTRLTRRASASFGPPDQDAFDVDQQRILSAGHSRSSDTFQFWFVIGPPHAAATGTQLVQSLGEYIGGGLERLGFEKPSGFATPIGGSAFRYIDVWRGKASSDFTVVIEVVAELSETNQAYGWASVIENQSLLNASLSNENVTGIFFLIVVAVLIWLMAGGLSGPDMPDDSRMSPT
jgi:hypothetical protein